ncbi:MAG: hypothetical protein EA379_02515 [Phycisphaerales bacterium]|nr:MAG: hypothetical protein EA379_02515 [Phycisphaerales bacterium]
MSSWLVLEERVQRDQCVGGGRGPDRIRDPGVDKDYLEKNALFAVKNTGKHRRYLRQPLADLASAHAGGLCAGPLDPLFYGAAIAHPLLLIRMLTRLVHSELVRKLPRRNRLGALGATLRVCGPDEADAILQSLLHSGKKRPSRLALEAAARNWSRLATDRQKALLQRVDDLPGLINTLAGGEDPEARIAAAGLITRGATAPSKATRTPPDALVQPLAALLADPDQSVRHAATDAVLALAAAASDEPNNSYVRYMFDCAIALGAQAFPEHRRREVMDLVIGVIDAPGPRLRAWLASPDEPGRMALRAALRRRRGPDACALAAHLLADRDLGGAAIEVLGAVSTDDEREAALTRPSLFAHPRARARLARAAGATDLLGDERTPERLSDAAREGWLELVRVLPMDDRARLNRLASRLADPEPRVRAKAARICAGARPSEARDGLLRDFACAAEAPAARHALVALIADRDPAREPALRDALGTLERSPHASVRALAFFSGDTLDADLRPERRRAQLIRDRDACVRDLRVRVLHDGDDEARIESILIARRLGVAHELELELLAAAGSPCVRVCAAAAGALRSVPTETARAALARLASHTDDRVRANAVDALSARDAADPAVAAALRDDAPRVVAGAIAGLARTFGALEPDARLALRDLLAHDDERARLAGLWAAMRGGVAEAAPLVARRIRLGVSDHERRLAARCARHLLLRMERHAPPANREQHTDAATPEIVVTPRVAERLGRGPRA